MPKQVKSLRVDARELERWKEAAAPLSVSEWLRSLANNEIRKQMLQKMYPRKVVPDTLRPTGVSR
jgi:hypothetical protein